MSMQAAQTRISGPFKNKKDVTWGRRELDLGGGVRGRSEGQIRSKSIGCMYEIIKRE